MNLDAYWEKCILDEFKGIFGIFKTIFWEDVFICAIESIHQSSPKMNPFIQIHPEWSNLSKFIQNESIQSNSSRMKLFIQKETVLPRKIYSSNINSFIQYLNSFQALRKFTTVCPDIFPTVSWLFFDSNHSTYCSTKPYAQLYGFLP